MAKPTDIDMRPMVEKANTMVKMAGEMANEMDPDKALANAQKLMAMGKELEKMGDDMRAQVGKERGMAQVEVVLTPDQRKRILNKTGVAMETLLIDDQAGAMNLGMPTTRPEQIEVLAMQEAERRKHAAEADKLVRAELDRAIYDIEAQGNAELSDQLARLKADPNFAGGLLNKK
jgi:hypothetical protein